MKTEIEKEIYESPKMIAIYAFPRQGFALSSQDNAIDNMGKWDGWEPVDENN